MAITPKKQIDNIVKLTFKGQSAQVGFTYDLASTVQLTSLSAKSASPYSRDLITITGSNFGTYIPDLSVQLRSAQNTYDEKIVTATNTQLVIKLQGGRAGNYDMVVNRKGWGDSYAASTTADDFVL